MVLLTSVFISLTWYFTDDDYMAGIFGAPASSKFNNKFKALFHYQIACILMLLYYGVLLYKIYYVYISVPGLYTF